MAGKIEPIFQHQGYLLGSVGGTLANYDYGSPDGQVVFMYIGNPFHISSPRLAKHWNFTAAWGIGWVFGQTKPEREYNMT